VEDRASASSEEDEDADAKDGASLRDRERLPLPSFLLPLLHDRFGDGRESFLARDCTESFIVFLRRCPAGGDEWAQCNEREAVVGMELAERR